MIPRADLSRLTGAVASVFASQHSTARVVGIGQEIATSTYARTAPVSGPEAGLLAWAPRVLSILRIVAALMFMAHGTQKLFGFPVAPPNGFPAVGSQLWIGGVIELVGGALLALGLFTRPVAFLVSGLCAVAYFQFHGSSIFPIVNRGELAALYCFVFLYLVFAGPGPWSVDAMLRGRRSSTSYA